MTVEDYADAADAFLRGGKHPTLGRAFHECGYLPMIELLRYLEANGFTNYIASGGDRDFMRPVTEDIYGIPSERVIGSSNALALHRRRARRHGHVPGASRTSSTTARSSRCGSGAASGGARSSPAGNSNGDIPMLRYAGGKARPALRLLRAPRRRRARVRLHRRRRDVLEQTAAEQDWTVVSIKNDWATVFAG